MISLLKILQKEKTILICSSLRAVDNLSKICKEHWTWRDKWHEFKLLINLITTIVWVNYLIFPSQFPICRAGIMAITQDYNEDSMSSCT